MTKVSRWTLDEKREKKLLNQLWTAITLLEDKKEVIDFLRALFTPSESIMLAKRIDLVRLLSKDMEINKIRKLLHISKVTAYKWKERYELYQSEFDLVVDRLKLLEKRKLEKEKKRRDNADLPRLHYQASLGKDLGNLMRKGRKKYKKAKKRKSSQR